MPHRVFFSFLLLVVLSAAVALGVRGWAFYSTPVEQRAARPDYEAMKPSGGTSHMLGSLGTALIVAGVVAYSGRKRLRPLREAGSLSRWLEVHIFLCLLGPVLVVYHTTFKAGGVAAISLWTMLSVAASGVVGRFFYTQLPRNIRGVELSAEEISAELQRLGERLSGSPLGAALRHVVDDGFAAVTAPRSLAGLPGALWRLHGVKRQAARSIRRMARTAGLSRPAASAVSSAALERAGLLQKSILLRQVESIFTYWHAVHLPFTAIMFITLALHVAAAFIMGYTHLW